MAYGYKRKRRYTRKRRTFRRRRTLAIPHRRYSSSSGARARHRARVLGRGPSKPRYVAKRTAAQMSSGTVWRAPVVRDFRKNKDPRNATRPNVFWNHAKEYATNLASNVAKFAANSFHQAIQHPELIESARKVARTAGPMIEEVAEAAETGLMLTL